LPRPKYWQALELQLKPETKAETKTETETGPGPKTEAGYQVAVACPPTAAAVGLS